MPLSRAQRDALDRSVSATRMGTYLRASGGDPDLARARYLWDRELAVAFFADIALLEIALRNAMNDRLADRWGAHWYERVDVPLDDRTAAQLAEAHGRVVGPKLPGRVVAQCTFGYAHQVVTRVNALRNRVAHHEPLIAGYPLPGQRGPDGRERRRSAVEGFGDLLRLAGMIDRDLRALLLATSAVPAVLDRRPRPRDVRRRVVPVRSGVIRSSDP